MFAFFALPGLAEECTLDELARLSSQLEASTTQAVKGEDAVQLGHALVYSWTQGSGDVKSHL